MSGPEGLDYTVEDCIGVAAEDGYTRDDLEFASRGNLRWFLREAIQESSGEDVL